MPSENENIATPEEVLQIFTQIMRGRAVEDGGSPKVSEQLKAAELLGKRYGLFSEKEAAPQPREEISAEIERSLEEMTHQHGPPRA